MKNTFLLLFVIALQLDGYCQFNESVGNSKPQIGWSVQATLLDSGYVIAGSDRSAILGEQDAFISNTRFYGPVRWATVYGGLHNDEFRSVREIASSSTPNIPLGYAAFGTSKSFSAANNDFYFVRTNTKGIPVASFIYGRKGDDLGYCLQPIKDYTTGGFGYVMVGQSNSYTDYFPGNSTLVVKTDEFGNLNRATILGGSGEDVAYWIEQVKGGGYILVGSTTSRSCTGSPDDKNIFVVHLDKDLRIQWNKIIGHPDLKEEDIAYGVIQDPYDGSFTITGLTKSYGQGDNDAFLLNLKSDGSFNWMKTYGTEKSDVASSIHFNTSPHGDGEYVISGTTTGYSGSEDAFVFRTDRYGNLKWSFLYGTKGGTETAAEITNSYDDGFIFTGLAKANFSYGLDAYLVKINHDGKSDSDCQQELALKEDKHAPCETSSLQQVYVDDFKRVTSNYKRLTYKAAKCDSYYETTSLGTSSEFRNETFVVTPNPASNTLTLNTTIQNSKGGTIKIINQTGKVFSELIMNDLTMAVAIGNLPKGIYIVSLITPSGEQYKQRFIKE